MPPRKIHRTLRTHTTSTVPLLPTDGVNYKYSALGANTIAVTLPPVAPKHIPLNCTIVDSDFVFELRIFLYTIIGAATQFLNLYRSVWWIPYTANNYPFNYFLIDPFVVAFIFVILSRRLLYYVVQKGIEIWCPMLPQDSWRTYIRVLVFLGMMASLIFYASHIICFYSIVNILYLCYPLAVYIMFFGITVMPLYESVTDNANGLPPLHACTNVASDIRSEVEEHRKNFNNRIKQILFNSVVNAYYAALLPCCFAQNFVYYDVGWASLHVAVIWFGCFTTYTVHLLPIRYCDTLHRAALHLGYWQKMELSSLTPAVYPWNVDILWPFGAIVKHGKELYRSWGEVNAAEPGHSGHIRFFTIFVNPPLSFSILLGVQAVLVFLQLVLLVRSYTCWYCIVSTSLLLVFNYYTLYAIGRNFFFTQRLYGYEQAMHEKATN